MTEPVSTDDLLRWRGEFPILEKTTYLISNSLGAMPRGVYDKLREYADTWATLGVRAWGAGWWDLKGAVGNLIAPLMGAPAGSVLVHENASIANSILLSALDFGDSRRDKVVVSDMDFPSDVYTLRRMLPPHMQLHMVRSRDGITLPIDELLDAIDERTRLVSLSHVLFRSAYILPADAIVEKARRVGAQVLLNGYHSVGVIPVDVTALNVDFYIGGTLKWMCGGPGGVFMYVRPDLLKTLNPRITGWFAHPKPASRLSPKWASNTLGASRCGRRRWSSSGRKRQATRSTRRAGRTSGRARSRSTRNMPTKSRANSSRAISSWTFGRTPESALRRIFTTATRKSTTRWMRLRPLWKKVAGKSTRNSAVL